MARKVGGTQLLLAALALLFMVMTVAMFTIDTTSAIGPLAQGEDKVVHNDDFPVDASLQVAALLVQDFPTQ
ncbi:MAG TPA: hypothetical protein PKW95_17165 [bacterium]|nr:hypothetical protein [bacterium]